MSQTDSIRASFKQSISKLNEIDTRAQALKQIQTLILQNKTTNNLRVWLSVLSENRKKHIQSQVYVIDYIIKVYGKNLLDPIDKIPSLEKSLFRVTQILSKYFGQQLQNVAIACQKTWIDIYQVTLKEEPLQIKKKLLYDNLEAIINGGGGKIAQTTAQFIADGLLQRALTNQDLQFFKQIAKRVLVLFLKTTVIHPSTLCCLQTIIGFFNINNLIPLLQQIIGKILSYIPLAQANSTGYKIKGEVCNSLGVIGEQIDRNGVQICDRIIKILNDLATDKVWAVQAPGRKALQIWMTKKRQWDQQFVSKNQRVQRIGLPQQVTYVPVVQKINESPLVNLKQNVSQYPKTSDNWMMNKQQQSKPLQNAKNQTQYNANWNESKNRFNYKSSSQQQPNFLHKNSGPGGGNNYLSAQNYAQRQKAQQTHLRKMQQIRKSIYQSKSQVQFEDTVVLDEKRTSPGKQILFRNDQSNFDNQEQDAQDDDFLFKWQKVLQLAQRQKFQESIKILLQMDDDLYFLRFFLKYSSQVLAKVTRPTSNKVLQKMLNIKKTNFMQQLLFKLVAESAKLGIGRMLTNSQNLQITNHLQSAGNISGLKQISKKLIQKYENSLQ